MTFTHTSSTSPALTELLAGNHRFVSGEVMRPHASLERVRELASGQAPKWLVFGCADSRVPIELVFDQGVGDIFVVRNAGHVLDDLSLASLEFAVAELGVECLVVVGHQRCGAIAATLAHLEGAPTLPGHLQALPDTIAPHISQAYLEGRPADAPTMHVRATVDKILGRSSLISEAVEAGKLSIHGGVYCLDNGQVAIVTGQDEAHAQEESESSR